MHIHDNHFSFLFRMSTLRSPRVAMQMFYKHFAYSPRKFGQISIRRLRCSVYTCKWRQSVPFQIQYSVVTTAGNCALHLTTVCSSPTSIDTQNR